MDDEVVVVMDTWVKYRGRCRHEMVAWEGEERTLLLEETDLVDSPFCLETLKEEEGRQE